MLGKARDLYGSLDNRNLLIVTPQYPYRTSLVLSICQFSLCILTTTDTITTIIITIAPI
jgi:hypothetical protein